MRTASQYQKLVSRLDRYVPEPDTDADLICQTDFDDHRNTPRADPVGLYGLVGEVADHGSRTSEANPFAVAAAFISYLSVAIGRGPYMDISDDRHHARIFGLHVGRSGIGRKGTATKLVRRIASEVEKIDSTLAPKIHSGGLSSGEGLALLIHDGYVTKAEKVPAIEDKRLWVLEGEFGNVLQQTKRQGSILSAVLRDCWDGGSIQPATKSQPVWASDTHIGLTGNITQEELLSLLNKREISNGFLNRFLFYWAEQGKVLAFPEPTPEEVVRLLAHKVVDILRYVGASHHTRQDVMKVTISSSARLLYEELYRSELSDASHGSTVNALVQRRAPMLLRLAMLFALTDREQVIGTHHLKAAMAWIRYSVESVQYLFHSAKEEAHVAEVKDASAKILNYLCSVRQATRTEISQRCFQGHASKHLIDSSLDALLCATPVRIEVYENPPVLGRPGKRTKVYRLLGGEHSAVSPAYHEPRTDCVNMRYGNADDRSLNNSAVEEGKVRQLSFISSTSQIDSFVALSAISQNSQISPTNEKLHVEAESLVGQS